MKRKGMLRSTLGVTLFLVLGAILACGEEATPTPTATPITTPVLDAAEISSIVQQAVQAATAQQPAPITPEELQSLVEQAVAAQAQPGASPQEIQRMVQDAVAAAAQPGVTAAEVEALVSRAVEEAVAQAVPATTPTPSPFFRTNVPGALQGTLNVAIPDIPAPNFVLNLQNYQQGKTDSVVTHEHMFAVTPDGEVVPQLVKSWTIDSSGPLWKYTFNLQEGVEWHKGHGDWGTFTADDFIFSIETITKPGSFAGFAGQIRRAFTCDQCQLTKVDDLTVLLERPGFTADILYGSNAPNGMSFQSKRHFDAVGEDVANQESVGTGPWELVEARSDEFRRHQGINGHWRKTPEFAELVWWDIGEESTRVANFLSGLLDTGAFTLDGVEAIRGGSGPEVKFMSFPGRKELWINLYGGQYYPDSMWHQPSASGEEARVPLGEGATYKEFCKTLPWVSCNRNTSSVEWDKARKVRLAMSMALDRRKMVNSLAYGRGQPIYISHWASFPDRIREFGLDQLEYEHNPVRARELLAEAGYSDGFNLEMHLSLFFPPGAPEFSEAACGQWAQIGITCEQFKEPYGSYRPLMVKRLPAVIQGFTGPTPQPEPLMQTGIYYTSPTSFNFGWEHPEYEALVDEATQIANEQDRWAKMAEMARWRFENVLPIPVYAEDTVWPVGPRIDVWEPLGGYMDWLSNFEYTPHRQ